MVDIVVPIARVVELVVINDEQIPYDMKGQLSGAVRTSKQVEDFAHAIGRTSMPSRPLMIHGPDDHVPIVIIGDGVTEAAEIEDLALEALDRQEENIKKHGRGFDFNEAREKSGLPRKEDFPQLFSDAMSERVELLKRNKVSMQGKRFQRRFY